MDNKNLNRELDLIGKYMVSQIRREMTINKRKATGDLYRSIDYNVGNNELNIESLDYGSVILGEGSRPSLKSPSKAMVSRIMRWMSYKTYSRGRKKSPSALRYEAWNLSKRILERGIEGSNIIQDAVKRLENRIDKGIVEAYKADIEREFSDVLIRINKENG